MDQEDREELEREQQLRERFSQKIEEAMPQHARHGTGNCSSGTCGAQPTSSTAMFFRFMFFLTSILLLLGLTQITDANSPLNLMRSMPWWQLPISSVSYFTLMAALLPYREQRRIKEEYEAASKLNPSLTLDQFFAQRYPTIFQGYHTQQQEVVAAVSACFASANDLKFVKSVSRAAGSARDIRASVDNIIGTLKRDYPHLFQSNGTSPVPSMRV
ncbi:hypothetical protein TraAM80_03903 [Trypanosoma rangeli]|uniref:Uncharacterized protein n=1 Tax=Trypanosoma rangeli TaxID=5698 RepID=A0A3R7L2S3_TRYRA|nr:uncharacterized protein TraAM80_03903 [Trypanosoma rangeli]RNF06436.1 hypothetical protein TraAM80_03903 [Trypanosoma rangeli]|eukprot:RNF06436.1 hypothetical protein TraAM80_03903 [Trypanosoma rangeli]